MREIRIETFESEEVKCTKCGEPLFLPAQTAILKETLRFCKKGHLWIWKDDDEHEDNKNNRSHIAHGEQGYRKNEMKAEEKEDNRLELGTVRHADECG
jgi:hypothetical protein